VEQEEEQEEQEWQEEQERLTSYQSSSVSGRTFFARNSGSSGGLGQVPHLYYTSHTTNTSQSQGQGHLRERSSAVAASSIRYMARLCCCMSTSPALENRRRKWSCSGWETLKLGRNRWRIGGDSGGEVEDRTYSSACSILSSAAEKVESAM
jgi:hypothetical protein